MTVEGRRFDAIKIDGGLKPYRRASDGAVLFDAVVTREGILEYRRADGSIRRERVSRQAVIDTAKSMPHSVLTLGHPEDGLVDPDNYAKHAVGNIDGSSMVEEDAQGAFARVRIAVRRRDALNAIDDGVEELSAGYTVIMDETPGSDHFGDFDAVQVGRVCNHTALVPAGRAGGTVALLRADSQDSSAAFASRASGVDTTSKDQEMNKGLLSLLLALGIPPERTDNEDAALSDGLAAAKQLTARATRADAAEGEAEEATSELDKLKEDYAKVKADLEAVTAENTKMKEAEDARADAAELAELRALAETVKLDGADKLAAPALRLALVQTKIKTADAGWSVDRMGGVIEAIRADAAAGPASFVFGRNTETRVDSFDADEFRSPTLDGPSGGSK